MEAAALAELILRRQPCVVLTGAGISTESGIPDFRSAEGIWGSYDPMEVATIEAFRRDPARVWQFYARRLGALHDAEPNDGHRALAELEHRGLVRAIVTQNVDSLHTRAGSEDVIEVHGSLRRCVCLSCGAAELLAEVSAQLEVRPVPECGECGAPLKPGVVMFGELLPVDAFQRAERLAREAALTPRGRVDARGLARRRPPGRDASRRRSAGDREPWTRPRSMAGLSSGSKAAPARCSSAVVSALPVV